LTGEVAFCRAHGRGSFGLDLLERCQQGGDRATGADVGHAFDRLLKVGSVRAVSRLAAPATGESNERKRGETRQREMRPRSNSMPTRSRRPCVHAERDPIAQPTSTVTGAGRNVAFSGSASPPRTRASGFTRGQHERHLGATWVRRVGPINQGDARLTPLLLRRQGEPPLLETACAARSGTRGRGSAGDQPGTLPRTR
jgi:hypothetical protein